MGAIAETMMAVMALVKVPKVDGLPEPGKVKGEMAVPHAGCWWRAAGVWVSAFGAMALADVEMPAQAYLFPGMSGGPQKAQVHLLPADKKDRHINGKQLGGGADQEAMTAQDYIPARTSHLNYYRAIPLYYLNKDDTFGLYKPPGKALSEMRIEGGNYPRRLYIKQIDKLKSIQEVQRAFNRQLEDHIQSGDPESVKTILVTIVEETFTEPRSGSVEGLSETVNLLVSDYAGEANILKTILGLSQNDYTSALHSVNVMALAIGYASQAGFPLQDKKILGLSALLHDIGKTRIDAAILTAPRKLSEEEFERIKAHPTIGYNILDNCRFPYAEIKLCALQHHEKGDGSGYPRGLTRITPMAQIVGLIDCYEALTNDDRPYRTAMDPLKGLSVIKKDVMAGKFSREIFETFAYSLL